MGSSKDEALSKKIGIAFFIASTNSLSCINELLNFLLPHSERCRSSILEQNDLITQTELFQWSGQLPVGNLILKNSQVFSVSMAFFYAM